MPKPRHADLPRVGSLMLLTTALVACGQSGRAPDTAASSPGASPHAASPRLGALAVSGAAFTTVNPTQVPISPDTQRCENGQDLSSGTVNCNIYNRKDYVWINGGPKQPGPSALSDGWYFFAVLEPSGQNNPNDGGKGNLSDTDPLGGSGVTGGGDAYTNRLFRVSGGDIVQYGGTHAFDNPGTGQGPMINAIPFDDTSNPGGVYIMALCKVDKDTYDPLTNPAKPKDCKYDAFKVKQADPPPNPKYGAQLSGFKYNDYSKSGQRDLGEPGLANWTIGLTCTGPRAVSTTLTTDADGFWTYDFGLADAAADPTVCTVAEVQQGGWRQTGNTGKDALMLEDGAEVALSNFVYTVTLGGAADATVTQLNFGNIPQGTVSGRKYLDFLHKAANGQYDDGEQGIAGWTVNYTGSQAITDAQGLFSVTLDPGTYTFAEQQRAGWLQTGNTVNQAQPGSAATLSNKVYTVTVDRDAPSTVVGVNFGNLPLGRVDGAKRYGDTGAPIGGWKVSLSGTNALGQSVGPLTRLTAPDGSYSFADLVPGTYTVTEALPSNNTASAYWTAVSATSYTVGLDGVTVNGTAPATAPDFRNICFNHPGGRTLGFWSNTNGQALITAGDLAALVAYNLRNANGSNFDPASKTAYRNWLLSATATNAAYMLSAQMSATHLSLQKGFTNDVVVVEPSTGRTSGQMVAYANTLLGLNGLTVNASADRTEQLRVKDILDKINNNGTLGAFQQPSPKACPAPVFP